MQTTSTVVIDHPTAHLTPTRYADLHLLAQTGGGMKVLDVRGICQQHEVWALWDQQGPVRHVYVARPTEGSLGGLRDWHNKEHEFPLWPDAPEDGAGALRWVFEKALYEIREEHS